MKNKSLIIIFMTFAIIISLANAVFATTTKVVDDSLKGSLTLTAYEFINGDENNKKELEGAEFTIYNVTTDIEDVSAAEEYITNNTVNQVTKVTDSTGLVKFSDLELGRYFVKQTDAPKNVLTKVESFLVDIPSTTPDGTEWNYDIVAYPKNVTVYANVELNKKDENDNAMQGVKFILQKLVDEEWVDYELENNLVTDENGQIKIQNLEVGKYRLVEVENLDKYIVDSNNTQDFEVTLNNTEFILNMNNETVEINKYVKLNNGNYGKNVGLYSKNIADWKITSTIPSIIEKMETYIITEELGQGLDIIDSSIIVYGIKGENKELLNTDNYTLKIENQIITFDFETNTLKDYQNLEIEYQTSINSDVEYGKEITSKTSIEYTNNIQVDKTEKSTYTTIVNENTIAEVHTGQLLIFKTDGKNALQGAIFKIATSKENAENGVYVTDINGEDITAISDENGYIVFQGLAYGEDDISAENGSTFYWIVEVQSPSYEENGETKYYNLLQKPVKVQVDSSSGVYSDNTTIVINKKGFILPKTGGIGIAVCTALGIGLIASSTFLGKKKKEDEK